MPAATPEQFSAALDAAGAYDKANGTSLSTAVIQAYVQGRDLPAPPTGPGLAVEAGDRRSPLVNVAGEGYVPQMVQFGSRELQQFLSDRLSGQAGMYQGPDSSARLDQVFAQALYQAAQDYERATGQRAVFNEMYRPPEVQAQYYANRIGIPFEWNGKTYLPEKVGGPAAFPGRSMHQTGRATDIPRGAFLDWMHQNAGRYGLAFPLANDRVHVQLASGRGNESVASTARAAQEMLAAKGFYKGEIDGLWGPQSRAAWNAYVAQAGPAAGNQLAAMARTGPAPAAAPASTRGWNLFGLNQDRMNQLYQAGRWRSDPIGQIRGIGQNFLQALQMAAGPVTRSAVRSYAPVLQGARNALGQGGNALAALMPGGGEAAAPAPSYTPAVGMAPGAFAATYTGAPQEYGFSAVQPR